jgi:hypothetical protein
LVGMLWTGFIWLRNGPCARVPWNVGRLWLELRGVSSSEPRSLHVCRLLCSRRGWSRRVCMRPDRLGHCLSEITSALTNVNSERI